MTTVFFAGAEVETLTRALLDNGVRRILYSYYYIYQMRREGFIARMQEEYPDVQWFLDSGAYTYFKKWEAEPHKLIPWRQYRKLYMTYINDTWERWVRVTELDFDMIPEVNEDLLAEWRDEMCQRWPQAPIMPVWHPNRGLADWTSYCRDRRFKHLAIGSGITSIGVLRKLIMEARTFNKQVHGFGVTRVNTVLHSVPYDSVDSTSWLMGQKFGTIFIFRNNKFKLIGKDGSLGKKERRQYRLYFRNIGCDWRKIEADDGAEVRKANVIAWRNLGERLHEIRKRQGRSLYGEERNERLNSDFVWKGPRPRELNEVDTPDDRRPQERTPTGRGEGLPGSGEP